MNPIDKARVLRKLEHPWCGERKEMTRRHGATTDNALIEFVIANDRTIRAVPRMVIVRAINEWAGHEN